MKTPIERHFDQVATELREAEPIPGLWARAYSDAHGDMNRARALYIRYRAEVIADAEARETRKIQEEEKGRLFEQRSLQTKVLGIRAGLVLLMILGVLSSLLAISGLVSAVSTRDWSSLFVAAIFGPLGAFAILRARNGFVALK